MAHVLVQKAVGQIEQALRCGFVGHVDGAGAPVPVQPGELVEVAAVVQWLAAKTGEACLHGLHVVAQAGPGAVELDAVATNDVRAHLGAQTETELAVGGFVQLPCHLCGDHRAARERHCHTGAELQFRSGGCGDCGRQVGGSSCLGEQDAVEPDVAQGLGGPVHPLQRLRGEHDVDVHAASVGRGYLANRREPHP